jgi:hypothetical protein
MSVRTSSDGTALERQLSRFDSWPGILGLAYGLVAGPLSMLMMQLLAYEGVQWACGQKALLKVHVVPILFLVFTIVAFMVAYRDWRAVGSGTDAEHATVVDRTRFIALCGMVTSAFSVLLIVGMWMPLFVFHPCQW